jgi:hypothetical protein
MFRYLTSSRTIITFHIKGSSFYAKTKGQEIVYLLIYQLFCQSDYNNQPYSNTTSYGKDISTHKDLLIITNVQENFSKDIQVALKE